MGKLIRKNTRHNYIYLSQFEDEMFAPIKQYDLRMSYKRGWVVVEVADDDYFGGGCTQSYALRPDQARRLRGLIKRYHAELFAERDARRQKLAPLLDVGLDDIPF